MTRRRLWLVAAATAAIIVLVAGYSSFRIGVQEGKFAHIEDFEGGEPIDPNWWYEDIKGKCAIDIVESPAGASSLVARFVAGRGARCEMVHWPRDRLFQWFRREPFHRERWYAMSVYLPKDRSPGEPGRNEVLAQWHASGDVWFLEAKHRAPPLALRIQENRWRITFGWDPDLRSKGIRKANRLLWEGPAALGQWTQWVFRVVWSHRSDGRTEIWKDGAVIVDYEGPNTFNDLRGVYLKIGSYHPRDDQVVYFDDVRVGNSCVEVFPVVEGRTIECDPSR